MLVEHGQKVVELDINEITLLSAEEYTQYKNHIFGIGLWWWLRSPSDEDVQRVLIAGRRNIESIRATVDCGGVRPALRISNMEPVLKVGATFHLADEQWCVISPDLALASRCLTFMPFRRDGGTDYEGSEVEKYLQRWAADNELDIQEAGSRVDLKEVYDTLVEILTS